MSIIQQVAYEFASDSNNPIGTGTELILAGCEVLHSNIEDQATYEEVLTTILSTASSIKYRVVN